MTVWNIFLQVIESTYCAECKRRCDFTESMLAIKRAQVVLVSCDTELQ
jgi:hypothetical protein